MSRTVTNADDVSLEEVLILAQRLDPIDQVRLIARLAPKVERVLAQVEPSDSSKSRKSLRGLLADLGPAPSAEDIGEIQHELWSSFAQE